MVGPLSGDRLHVGEEKNSGGKLWQCHCLVTDYTLVEKLPRLTNWKPPVLWGFGIKNRFGNILFQERSSREKRI